MKAQLAPPAAGPPARSPSRMQRQASAGPAPDTSRGLPARAGRGEHAAIHAAAARGIATSWSALPHAGAIQRRLPTQVLASRAIAQPKLSIDGPRGAAAATAIAPTGGGSPLPTPTRARMEGLFGLHLDGVRVVESGQPERLGARAFAIGHEIHAARGEDLAASRNAELLGHELAHVVQQRQGRARPSAAQDHGGTLVVDAALEAEADAVGARIERGEPAGIGGAAAACPAPVAQGYQIDLEGEPEPFTSVDQLIETLEEAGLGPREGWNDAPRALLFQWMREDRAFPSRDTLIDDLENTPAPQPATAPANVRQLVERYEGVFAICKNANEVLHFVGNRRALTQVPQERGDMFDVASALALDHDLCVVVIPDGRPDDCDKILDFYRDFQSQVFLVTDVRVNRRQLNDMRRGGQRNGEQFLSVSRSTQIMLEDYEQSMYEHGNAQGFRATLADTMTGRMDTKDEKAFEEELVRRGFHRGTRYALVMYRDSGHNPGRGRAPSHPELDTGVQGFEELFALTGDALQGRDALTPVPMGTQPPPGFNIDRQPNLINYWAWDCFRAYPEGTIRRQKENALLRYLRREYSVVAIGMRSGGMDALAYVGIPIISIDIAAEFMSKQDLWDHWIEDGSAASWRRAAKKETMLEGNYHNVYLDELRHDPNINALYDRDRPATSVEFDGAFGEGSQRQLGNAVARYFGRTPAHGLDSSSPLSRDNTAPLSDWLIARDALERNSPDRRFFERYAEDPRRLNALLEATRRNTRRGSAAASARGQRHLAPMLVT